MKRAIAVPILCLLGLLIGGLGANAAGPARVPAPALDPRYFNCPGYVLRANFPANQQYALIFTHPDGSTEYIITGRLVATFTNLSNPNNTLTANISGPAFFTFYPDGSETDVFTGLQTVGLLSTFAGRVSITITADGQLTVSMSGHVLQDICSALA
jgi:hypothetical protein